MTVTRCVCECGKTYKAFWWGEDRYFAYRFRKLWPKWKALAPDGRVYIPGEPDGDGGLMELPLDHDCAYHIMWLRKIRDGEVVWENRPAEPRR